MQLVVLQNEILRLHQIPDLDLLFSPSVNHFRQQKQQMASIFFSIVRNLRTGAVNATYSIKVKPIVYFFTSSHTLFLFQSNL